MRWNILDTGNRIDGRDVKTVRPILCEVGVLPRTHGSALFTRGETQALVVATLGTGEDEQWIDALQGTYKESFLLHYNFPPFSVGETGRIGAPSRRDIGHGKLAWRAIHPVLPEKTEFPYTIRVVSEITESNGSSSMATVCGASLSLMDAGVPLKRPTAGIAMGLILEDKRFAVLSDILGDEDHLGDMDFKVAGTERGVTSLQMDIKIAGITEEIMRIALAQAKDGRMHILGEMAKALTSARAELGEHAPRIEVFSIPVDKIREVIGSGGKVIREIVEKTGAKIDISDDGTVKVASAKAELIKAAINWIKSIASDPEVGHIYEGTVVKVMDFGAFVNFFGSKDGLVHISQLAPRRVQKTSDVVKEGDKVKVKLLGFDERGKVRLSMKVVDQETGEDLEAKQKAEAAEHARSCGRRRITENADERRILAPLVFHSPPSKSLRRSSQAELGERGDVVIGGVLGEAAEHDPRRAAGRGRDFRGDGADRDARGAIRRKAVDAGRDRREGDRAKPMCGAKLERRAIAGGEQLFLARGAAAPDRADRVNHVLGRQPIAAGDLGAAGLAAAERFAFGSQLRTGGAVNGAIHAAAAEQRAVCRIDDRVERKRRDVGDADNKPRRADFGGQERRRVRHRRQRITPTRPAPRRAGRPCP